VTLNGPADFTIRSATEDDAAEVGALAEQFADYLRGLGDQADFRFNADAYVRDGFRASPAFAGIVAEGEGTILGYLLYHDGYDTDRAIRVLHVVDLYVRDDARRRGIGRALMDQAASICRERGGDQLLWSVFEPNRSAVEFYEHIGATYVQGGLRFMALAVQEGK
jgi:GNAT superfamily N-acetyltransferase